MGLTDFCTLKLQESTSKTRKFVKLIIAVCEFVSFSVIRGKEILKSNALGLIKQYYLNLFNVTFKNQLIF